MTGITINVIHDWNRKDRYDLLMKEVSDHKLDIKIWDAVKGFSKPKQNISEAHKIIVRWAKENHLQECVIGEDDLHFTHPNSWQYYLSKKPQDFDLYLATIMWGRILPDNTTSDFAGLQLYTIHERYYNKFIESDETRDIDRAQMRRGVFRICNPMPVIQNETMSDNGRKTIHRNAKLYFDKKLYDGTNG